MTALCSGGGPSQPKAGVQSNLVYAAGAAGIFAVTPGAEWLAPVATAIGVLTFQASQLCATDPPAMPTFNTGDYFALVIADPGPAGHTARQKVQDALAAILWPQVCECVSGPQPSAPTSPTNPSGTSYTSAPPPAQFAPCLTIGPFPHTVTATQTFNRSGPAFVSLIQPSYLRVTTTTAVVTSPAPPITFAHQFQDVSGTNTVVHTYVQNAGLTNSFIYPIPNDGITVSEQTRITAGSGAGSTSEQTLWEVFCNGQYPGGTATPCCPPDSATQATLDAILVLVTLIQRQIAPFSYVQSTTHTGLSGNGQFAVQGLIGLAVDLTTKPSRLGVVSGDPDTIFDAGWVAVGTADGWGPRHFISSDPFILRPVPGDITLVGYSIPADVAATITELVREP